VIPFLGAGLLRLLGLTWRTSFIGLEHLLDLRARKQPFVLVLWHGELFPLIWVHRGQGYAMLVSEHKDGELIARTGQHLGQKPVRGSSSRGGVRALLELVKLLKGGADLAFTPDGPRGPAHKFAPGALLAAQRAGAPILPVRIAASSAWRLKTWDRFLIPKPFARLSVAYGEPTFVEGEATASAEEQVPRFEALMERVGAEVDA
jgi:lysophospholipid acyltransferase (LPLAT)-like uncharacterized protein